MKISHETIAHCPLFPHTFITGVNGNKISQQYILDHEQKQNVFRRTEFSVTECWHSYFNGIFKKTK